MAKLNLEKFKKHQKLLSESIEHNQNINFKKYNNEYEAEFDGYAIHTSLVCWALNNIPTKKLKEYIEMHKLNEEGEHNVKK